MQPPVQFQAVKKQFQFTEAEMRDIKTELMQLRAELVRKTGVNSSQWDENKLKQIEQKIYSLEHQLAHAIILEKGDGEETREEDLLDELYHIMTLACHTTVAYCKHIFYQFVHFIQYTNRTPKNRAHKAK